MLNESHEDGENFLDEMLSEFRKLNNKHDWSNVDSTDLVNNFLKTEKKAMNLLHEELNILCILTLTYTGVKMYNKSWNKMKKVQTLMANLHKLTFLIFQILKIRKLQQVRVVQPKSLFKFCKQKLLHKYYHKVFLEIAESQCKLPDCLMDWESNSHIDLELHILQLQQENPFYHDSYSYPNSSTTRKQWEHCTMGPTHTLTNMRSRISRHGYDGVNKEAFLRVSETDHNVLPRTIIEDQLDKQSSDLAKQFFSPEVEKIL